MTKHILNKRIEKVQKLQKGVSMLDINNLSVSYGKTRVVRNLSLKVNDGEIVCIVGESGCGKSTALKSVLMLDKNASVTGGSIMFNGSDITKLNSTEIRQIRGLEIAMIFQNAFLSMDPTKTIGHVFYETVKAHNKKAEKNDCLKKAEEIMKKLRLWETERIFTSYPFELSGGMCQRTAIAAAMMNTPKLILADEPTSALDVTAQAQVIRLLKQVKEDYNTSMLIVTHNMGVVANLADKAAVMYGGSIMEIGSTKDIINNPAHPYTKALIKAVPEMNGKIPEAIEGLPPEFNDDISGCPFALRCSMAKDICFKKFPEKHSLSESHTVYCNCCCL